MTAFEPLLDRARAGERAALDELLRQLRPIIRALARRRLHSDNEASDLAHEVLLRMGCAFARARSAHRHRDSARCDEPPTRDPVRFGPFHCCASQW